MIVIVEVCEMSPGWFKSAREYFMIIFLMVIASVLVGYGIGVSYDDMRLTIASFICAGILLAVVCILGEVM